MKISRFVLWVLLLGSVGSLIAIEACHENTTAENCKICYTAFNVDQDTIFADELAEWVRNHKLGDPKPVQERFGKTLASMRGIYCVEHYGDMTEQTISDSIRATMQRNRYRGYLKSQCGEIGDLDYNGQ